MTVTYSIVVNVDTNTVETVTLTSPTRYKVVSERNLYTPEREARVTVKAVS